MFFRKKSTPPPMPNALLTQCANQLHGFCMKSVQDSRGVRVEDFITVAAAIVAERCIEAAGDYPVRSHTMAPGSRVFSDKINQLLSGDTSDGDITPLPADSVFGMLRDQLVPGKYAVSEFPSPKAVFQHFAASIGGPEDWGKAPLSIPEGNRPFVLPLRVAYETRATVDEILAPLGADPMQRLRATVLALAQALTVVAGAIDHTLVLQLAFETINGMAKTAPMTEAAMGKSTQTATAP